ncbi:MAG TPA: D-alanyl-D-alanine carboxypeptidase family protein [Chthoniobacterales bacterium]
MRIVALSLALALLACRVEAAEPPVITAKAALLFDATSGEVLLKKNENAQRPVASTQKLLTALIIAEAGGLDQLVTVEQSDTLADPTKLYLKTGDQYTRQELLSALLVKSANDVACALARDNAGSVEAFARKMNARIAELRGTNSHFINPNGLPVEGQYSTARDMAIVARAVYANPVLRDIISQKFITFRYASGKTVTLRNTNRLLQEYSFCNGMKTGYTIAAGHCLITSASWGGRQVIAVVLGDTKLRVRKESVDLLAYGLGISKDGVASMRVSSGGSAN